MPKPVSKHTATRSPGAWKRPLTLLVAAILLSGCAPDGAQTVKAVSLAPICERALRVVCVSSEDQITPPTADAIVRTNEAIAEGCKGVPIATRCPRGQKPRAVPQSIVTPEKATS